MCAPTPLSKTCALAGPHSGAHLNGWTRPEADIFADAAASAGVPREKIIVENRATNTGENISLSRALLAEHGIAPESIIVVQKPFMERRPASPPTPFLHSFLPPFHPYFPL